jgi:3-methyl-2-oxobutanoate hydroxymethyltransferase
VTDKPSRYASWTAGKLPLPELLDLKRRREKIVMVTAYDAPSGRLADKAGVDLILVGDSSGMVVHGRQSTVPVTLDEIVFMTQWVTRGATRPIVVADMPFGSYEASDEQAVGNAVRLVKEGGADMVKLDAAAEFPEAVTALTRAGIPVFAQFGLTPQTALKYGVPYSAQNSAGAQATEEMAAKLVEEAKRLEAAGAAMLDFTNSGPVAGPAVVQAVSIPVIGGFGGGPWLDGRVRLAQTALGSSAKWLDSKADTYVNTAKLSLEAFKALIEDVRAGRQIKG